MAYLDHAASTPLHPAAADAVRAQLGYTANASSLHAAGRRARRVVEESRERLAAALGTRPSEVVLTSGGTESDNLALQGVLRGRRLADPRRTRVVTSAVEHHAVLDVVEWLARVEGVEVALLPVDAEGRVDPAALAADLAEHGSRTALVSVMWANNEIGTVQPVADLAAVCAGAGVPLHSDAVQAVGQVPVDVGAAGVDLLSISGHKCGGPHGAGALVVGHDVPCEPLLLGGGQEGGLRSGTVDVPAVAGLAAAVEVAVAEQAERAERLSTLRDVMVRGVCDAVPGTVVNGPAAASSAPRLPGLAHLSFPGCEGDALLMLLDAAGVECSTGSACQSGVAQPSHVLLATGAETGLARASLRLSLGWTSTREDVDAVVAALGPCVERARRASAAGRRADGGTRGAGDGGR